MTVSQPALSSRSKIIRHRCSFEDVQRNKVIRNVFVCESRGGFSKHKKHFNAQSGDVTQNNLIVLESQKFLLLVEFIHRYKISFWWIR
jgi:hypothetical protein